MALILMVFIISQRLIELYWANRNTKRLISLGGIEHSPRHYSLIVLLHSSWIVVLLGSLWLTSKIEISAVYFAFFVLLTLFRIWILATLGSFFTTKIISLPGAPLRKTGPYRFFKHPNYVLVVFEIAVVPMIFGFWQIALIWGLANIGILGYRIQQEDLALKDRRDLSL